MAAPRLLPQRIGALLAVLLVSAVCPGTVGAIVGGRSIPISTAPWSVAVIGVHMHCSGVIIDRLHVVTAHHCLLWNDSPQPPRDFVIRAGVSSLGSSGVGSSLQTRAAVSFRVHPDPDPLSADIAVLRLARPLVLDGTHAQAVALWRNPTWPSGQDAAVSGFGRGSPDQQSSERLRQLMQRIQAQGTCGGAAAIQGYSATWICAGSRQGAVCFGDSGAGLVVPGSPSRLVGILSNYFGKRACDASDTNIYTFIGAPEVWRFIRGDDHPPLAPDKFALVFVVPPPHPGITVPCDGTGANGAKTRYAIYSGRTLVRSGPHPLTYKIRPADVGKRIKCTGFATNAGGTSVQQFTTRIIKP
jgi:hypothetical protein